MNGAEADDTGNAARLVHLDTNSEEARTSFFGSYSKS